MSIEFVETSTVGASVDLYEGRSDWLDRQISKAVLGQTATTDAVTGGLGSGKEHREVQEDIERADAKALAAIINRDLIRPWMQLNYGRLDKYPTVQIGRPEPEDLELLSSALSKLVPLGLRVSEREVREKYGLTDPKAGDQIMGVDQPTNDQKQPQAQPGSAEAGETRAQSAVKYPFNTQPASDRITAAQSEEGPSAANSEGEPELELAKRLSREAQPHLGEMIERVELMMQAASSMEELREMFLTAYPKLDASAFGNAIADAMVAAEAGGRAMVEEESG